MSRARRLVRNVTVVWAMSSVAAGPVLSATGDATVPVQPVSFLGLRCVVLPAALNLDPGMGRLAFEPGRWDEPAEGSPTVPNFAFSKAEPDEDPVCGGTLSRQAQAGDQGPGDDQTRDMSQTGISATSR